MATDVTFLLKAKQAYRHNAGEFDIISRTPVYTMEISAPSYVRERVIVKQSLIPTGDGHLWIWDIENNSDSLYPALFIIKKNGNPVPPVDHMCHL